MKKLLLILAMMPIFAMGQKEHVVKEYCQVFLRGRTLRILNGSNEWDIEYKDSLNKAVKLNSVIEMFDYMSENGWELVMKSDFHNKSIGLSSAYIFCRPKRQKKEGDK